MTPRIVVIGPPGAGKTTIAALVAERLGLPAWDTDADVEATAGRPIPDIFVNDGERAFRALERSAVSGALREQSGVVSLGGGSVLDPETEVDLHRLTGAGSTSVVFLDVQVGDASRRIGLNVSRPLLIGNPRAQWIRLMDARRPIYTRLATHIVVTDDRTPADVADEVVRVTTAGPSAG